VAGFFLQHTELVPLHSTIWIYGEPWDDVNAKFAEWFGIPEKVLAKFASVAAAASDKDHMKLIENIGELPTGHARTGKVRTKSPFYISESTRKEILSEFHFTLPQELQDFWYGDDQAKVAARQKIQSVLRHHTAGDDTAGKAGGRMGEQIPASDEAAIAETRQRVAGSRSRLAKRRRTQGRGRRGRGQG